MKSFNLVSHFLKDFSFNSPNHPALFFPKNDTSARIENNININIKKNEDNLYMVDILMKIHSILNKNSETIFSISIDYVGIVQLEHTEEKEMIEKILTVDVPQFLLPFINSFVLQLSNSGGFPPFLIQQIDFEDLYKQRQEQKPIDFFNI